MYVPGDIGGAFPPSRRVAGNLKLRSTDLMSHVLVFASHSYNVTTTI